jgi:peptide/nickel transport system permease protein
MSTYIMRRVALMLPVLLLVSVIVFVLIRAIPGDAVALMLEESSNEQAATQLREKLGLDDPLPVQFMYWLRDAVQGDLGTSLWTRNSVTSEIKHALPVTIELALLSMFIAALIAIPAGVFSAVKQDTLPDYAVRVVSIFGLSIPAFWLGTLFVMLPAIWFKWLPPTDYIPIYENPIGNIKQFILPALALGYYLSAITMRMMRSETLDVLRQDYIRTARAKGLGERIVVMRHGLRNALIPVITVLGGQMGALLGGVVIIEEIFLLPGLGRLTLWAIEVRDYPQIQANILMIVLLTLLVNLLTDISYGWLDPRIRY